MPTTTLREIGGLTCRVVDAVEDTGPDVVAVFCHGFGAPGDDLVPLADELLRAQPDLDGRTRLIFPQAPLDMAPYGLPGGRAWWPIDMLQLQAAIELGEFRNLRNECPALLPEARRLLMQLIAEVRAETELPLSRFVLGGFSQGAMLSTDVTLRLRESPGGLVIWSATLLCEDQWRPLAPHRAGLAVVQSHGYEDPILPYEAAGWLRDLLSEAGLTVRFVPFHGYHQIPHEAVTVTAELLAMMSPGPAPKGSGRITP